MRTRVSKIFLLEDAAKSFIEDLPSDSEPLTIPMINAEDKARGYPHPRIGGFKVAYWNQG